MFTKIKESCASRSLSKVRKVDDMLPKIDVVNNGIENAVVSSSSSVPGSSQVKEACRAE